MYTPEEHQQNPARIEEVELRIDSRPDALAAAGVSEAEFVAAMEDALDRENPPNDETLLYIQGREFHLKDLASITVHYL